MFYPTHPSFLFPFSHFSPSATTASSSFFSHSPVAIRKLNVMEGALKMGVVKDTSFKSSPKVYLDEFCPSSSSSDYFFVDQLLNFSNEEDGFIEEEEEEKEKTKQSISVSAPLQESDENSNHSSTNSSDDGFWSVSSRDFEDLEWLSHLVSDSSQEYSASAAAAPCSVSVFFPDSYQNGTTHQSLPKFGSNFKAKFRFPSKPRSKRAKISGRVWSSSSSSLIAFSPSAKKPKKNSTAEGPGRLQPPRRCSHCGVHKTPQWRAGPLGPKTLCNACGVRFKSGRLFPEYRPACSPSFSSELHSNHHRKVLEMRRQKETEKHPSGPDQSLGSV